MKTETFAPWDTNFRYRISSEGTVYDLVKNKPVSIQIRKDGYCKVSLVDESKDIYETGRQVNPFLHRLIATAFIPNPENLPEVNHKDRNKENCAAWNLEWCTHQNKIIHSFETRVMPSGKDHWNFGKEYGAEQKKAMSDAKLGENHPKFKGWYSKNGIRYGSAPEAAKATGENSRTIQRHAADGKNGWCFIPKPAPGKIHNVELEVTNLTPTPTENGNESL